MYGEKKKNKKFQSETAELITSKVQIDPWATYCFPNLFITNLMRRGYFLEKSLAYSSPVCSYFWFCSFC